jgi:hypothetical protein
MRYRGTCSMGWPLVHRFSSENPADTKARRYKPTQTTPPGSSLGSTAARLPGSPVRRRRRAGDLEDDMKGEWMRPLTKR